MTQRRRQFENKRSSSHQENTANGEKIAAAVARSTRRRTTPHSGHRSRFDYLLKFFTKNKLLVSISSYIPIIFIFLICLLVVYFVVILFINSQKYEYTNVPLKLPKLVNINDTAPENNPERFWGTYRSNLYFGIKHRSSQSLGGGLMWFDYEKIQQSNDQFLRHWCDHNDRLPSYGWTYHDGEMFGIEQIQDDNLHLQVEWVKRLGGQHGGDWTTRINVTPQLNKTKPVSLFFYFHHDLPWMDEIITSKKSDNEQYRLTTVRGQTNELDAFTIKFKIPSGAHSQIPIIRSLTERLPLHNVHQTILRRLVPYDTASASNSRKQQQQQDRYFVLQDQEIKYYEHNFFILQLTLPQPVVQPFTFDIIYESDSVNRQNELSGVHFNELITQLQKQFDERFESIFQLKTKQNMEIKKINFARSTLSNLLGGIAYFTGQSLVAHPNQKTPDDYWLTNLYTAVPSRSFFPRGFLWDEGFHNLLIARWNKNITYDILSHWLDLLNDNGWIPREMILGLEARARVPQEFIIQYSTNANPPTFFLTVDSLLKTNLNFNNNNDANKLQTFIKRLETWYKWYNRTQIGQSPFTYRWRGRNSSSIYELNPKTLTSGLDDYPRSSHPTDDERHLDLRCWMMLASNVIGKLYQKLNGKNNENNVYIDYAHLLADNERLNHQHWSETDGMYADYGLHTDHVHLQRVNIPSKQQQQQQQQQQTHMIRQVTNQSDLTYKFVKHFGYVSLFPLMTKILKPNSLKLDKLLTDLTNPTLLWTSFGLRSLSQTSALYNTRNTEHDPPYWRGAIWINMNYMVLNALNYYSKTPGPYQEKAKTVYQQLRTNLLNNMYRVYEKTGFVWEQYNDKTGNGQGTHPFTGWSSLIVLIMAELYDG
ncbi:unnamed protein product [Didymodactylos carnosus]|uniref:Mannosyl-oligosaccharide glucosidase n=1 Tax=Didymodactylos carnosus TaxID=1234261 RepID=A0A8S2HNT3_9BILA|nr:unnamed protein product [Didymodactylos carnosus]CAF3670890.1 unnamed protein product [Didymodactylos carnosus]